MIFRSLCEDATDCATPSPMAQWEHLSFAIFAIFDLKKLSKLFEITCYQVLTCLIFSFPWASFPIKFIAMPSGMYFHDFSTIYLISLSKTAFSMEKLSLSGYTIYLRLLAMKGFNALRSGYNCFISMPISIEWHFGF